MHIVKSDKYLAQLTVILRFIALDSPKYAIIFKQTLTEKVMCDFDTSVDELIKELGT